MSAERDPLVPSAHPAAPKPPPYPDQPPPYMAPPPSFQGGHPPSYAFPPPPQRQPYPPYGATSQHTVTVVQAQPVVRQIVVDIKPPNYVVLSVLVMVFGCCFFGLIALIFALQVDSAWADGDREGARRNSAMARGWSLAGIIFGVVLYVVIVCVAAAVSAS